MARQSTFLIDRLNDYYLGGMDDMAVWSANVWHRAIRMIDQGTEYVILDILEIDINFIDTFKCILILLDHSTFE